MDDCLHRRRHLQRGGKIEATGNILVWAPNTQGGTTAITAQNYTYPLTNTSLTFRNAAPVPLASY